MSDWIDTVVVSRRALALDVVGFELAAAGGGSLPPFEAGAHVDVRVGDDVRQYSLCCAPGSSHYHLGVLREADGRGGSRRICDEVREGQRLQIGRPRCLFRLQEGANRSVLLAGGIGITPLLSMAWRLHQLGKPFQLHYFFRSPDRAAFLHELAVAPFAPSVHLHADDGSTGPAVDLAKLVPYALGAHLYTCGPKGFMDAVMAAAVARGWPEDTRHQESFTSDIPDDAEGFEVELRRSGVTLRVRPDQTIAQAALAAGVNVPLSCEAGICGTCLTPVLEGTPDHQDHFMSAEEHARNDVISICCSRSLSPRMVLDL